MTVYKKTYIIAICAILAFSCSVSPSDEDNHTRYTPDGRPFVHLTIGAGNSSRALTDTLARAAINFYEVAFYDGTGYYRVSWQKGKTGRLQVPTFDYDTAAHAILFAGAYENDLTLLAVGLLTSVDGAPGTSITANTKSVEFTLVPFVSDVRADASSSFKITEPDDYRTAEKTVPLPIFPLDIADPPKRSVPLFLIPQLHPDEIWASFTLDLVNNISFDSYQAGIFAAGTGKAHGLPVYGNSPLIKENANFGTLDIKVDEPESGEIFTSNLITFLITPIDTHDFFTLLSFEVPVNAIKDEPTADGIQPLTWYIRGGLQNSLYDEGPAVNSMGGAIVLGVGDVPLVPDPGP